MLEITNAFTTSGEVFAQARRDISALVQSMVNTESFRRMQETLEQSFVAAVRCNTPAGRIAEDDVTYDGLVAIQRRINETVRAAAAGSVPHRFMAGATPEWTVRDDVEAYRRRVEAELTESGRARREQALAGPYITVDELRRQMTENDQWEAERAEYYRQAFDRIRERAAVGWPRRYATGGVIHEHRDPGDDSVPVVASPGEIWVSPDATPRMIADLIRASGFGSRALRSRDPDITHHDRWLGEGALERDETSSVHSTDSSGTGAVWSDLMGRIDDLIEE